MFGASPAENSFTLSLKVSDESFIIYTLVVFSHVKIEVRGLPLTTISCGFIAGILDITFMLERVFMPGLLRDCTTYFIYIAAMPEKHRHVMMDRLTTLIMRVLYNNPELHYYQVSMIKLDVTFILLPVL